MAKMQVFTYDNLSLYDQLLKGYVDAEDAKSLKTVAIEGNTLKFYRVSEPVGSTTPAYTITLPTADLSGLIPKIAGATDGNVVTAKADGTVADSGVAVADLATKSEVEAVDDKADANAIAITAINDANTGILKTAKNYADTKIRELADGAVASNTDAITILNGTDTEAGSVAKAVKDAKDELTTEINKKADSSTTLAGYGITDAYTKTETDDKIKVALTSALIYKGTVSTYADLPTADQKVGDVYNVATADSTHDIKAGDNVAWNGNDWDILAGTVDLSAYSTTTEVESKISTAKSEAISAAETDATTKANTAETNAKTYADGLNTAMDTRVASLESKVSDGFEAIPEASIRALFPTSTI